MAYWYCHFLNDRKFSSSICPVTFYIIPTISLCRDDFLDDDGNPEDCSFSIDFQWLFFTFSIIRTWGSAYDRTTKKRCR